MMHHDHTEIRIFCCICFQISFQPAHGILNGFEGCLVSLLTGGFRIHLEQSPGVTVHGDDVDTCIVEGAVTLHRCTIFRILNGINIGVKIDTTLVMIAAGINNRITVNEVIRSCAMEPETELFCLCTGAFYQITTMQHNIRIKILYRCVQFIAGCEDMGIRQGNHADFIGIFTQGTEACLTGFTIFQLYLVVIPGSSLKMIQFVVIQVHFSTLEIRCVLIYIHRNWIAE